ncbi:MAG: Nif3-like dinuclear metal center hexameric protein [Gemmatimonadales bacterium]|nr:MAG: Nif3-like dinuclear metal center hexameric protein [Gemmatimonadales bacterium]
MSKQASLGIVTEFLDQYLGIQDVPDYPNALNGLQVENSGRIDRVVAAVDASQATIDGVAEKSSEGSPLLLVHHGLFWDGNIPLTGRRIRRVRRLLASDIALYSAHLPLDIHPEVGNNVELARAIGFDVSGWFGDQLGVPIGVWGALSISRQALVDQLDQVLGTRSLLLPGGPEQVGRVGIITGGAGSMIAAARDAGLDTFITGEGAHHTYFDAMEWGINTVYAGHYATEQLGVQALARKVAAEFNLPWSFLSYPTGL